MVEAKLCSNIQYRIISGLCYVLNKSLEVQMLLDPVRIEICCFHRLNIFQPLKMD